MGKVTHWDHCFELPHAGSPEAERLTSALRRSGVSEAGVRQLLAGEVVSDVRDRQRLATMLPRSLDLASRHGPLEAGMLVPAVQVGTPPAPATAPTQNATLERLGVSTAGVDRFMSGLPVLRREDRQRLAGVAAAAMGRSRHPGMVQVMLVDGSTR